MKSLGIATWLLGIVPKAEKVPAAWAVDSTRLRAIRSYTSALPESARQPNLPA